MHQQPLQQHFSGFGQSMYQNRSYPVFSGASSQFSLKAQLKQPQQEDVFDEDAFEKAFEAAKVEVEQAQERQRQTDFTSNGNGNTRRRVLAEMYRHIRDLENEIEKGYDAIGIKNALAASDRYNTLDADAVDDYRMNLELLKYQNKERPLAGIGIRWDFDQEDWDVVQKQLEGQALSDHQKHLMLPHEQRIERFLFVAQQQRDLELKQQADVNLRDDMISIGSGDISTRPDHVVKQELMNDYQMYLMLLEQQVKRLQAEEQQGNMELKQQADVNLRDGMISNESGDILTRSDHLTEQERISSDRILHQDEDERAETQRHDEADDLARTAGQLLDHVKHDQSQKFQNSNFLALMRQLRDREVRVEGDRMVDVSIPPSAAGPKHYHKGPAELITCRLWGCERVDG